MRKLLQMKRIQRKGTNGPRVASCIVYKTRKEKNKKEIVIALFLEKIKFNKKCVGSVG